MMKNHRFTRITLRFLLPLILLAALSQIAVSQWKHQLSGTNEKLVAVVMLDSLDAIAVGNANAVLRTSNAGVSWFDEDTLVNSVHSYHAISFCDSLYGTLIGDQYVATTSNGGISWTPRTVPSTQQCLSVLTPGRGTIYVGSDSGWIYQSLDSGSTWNAVKASAWPIISFFRFNGEFLPGGPIYYCLTPHSVLSKAVYPSLNWQEYIIHNFDGLGSEACAGEFFGESYVQCVAGVFGDLAFVAGILTKPLGDTVWSGAQLSSTALGRFNGISAPSESIGYACGSSGIIFMSSDAGESWQQMSSGTRQNLNAIFFLNERRGIAVGDSGTILFTENGGTTGVPAEPSHLPKTIFLDQNYPNPFNPATSIRYRMSGSGFVSFRIFDVLGREVAILVEGTMAAGEHTVQWDAGELPSGVYFYELKVGSDFQQTRKMLLIK
jgi:photosystem II stability/assembly factor-like uncharacterized protein